MRTVLMCPKCGDISSPINERVGECIKCKHCGTERIKIDAEAEKMQELPQAELEIYKQRLCRKYLFSLPTFDEDAYESRLKKYQELEARLRREVEQDKLNQPHCPTCNSTNIQAISGLERGVSVVALGLFSKKINKSFKCGHCGYTW